MGGTLTGALTLAADPTLSMQAATKRYVDVQAATALPLSGRALTGPLTLPTNPAAALHAAPKQYVDSQVASALPVAGGTLTGALTLAGDPTSSLHAATKRYVDAAGGGSAGVINVRSAPYNAQLNGVTDDTAAFKAAYQAAAPGSVIYVPNGVTVMQTPPNWGIPLTKRVKWIVDGTSLSDGTPLANSFLGGGSPPGTYLAAHRFRRLPLVLHCESHRGPNGRRGHRQHAQRHNHIQQPQQFCLGRHRQTAVVRLADPER